MLFSAAASCTCECSEAIASAVGDGQTLDQKPLAQPFRWRLSHHVWDSKPGGQVRLNRRAEEVHLRQPFEDGQTAVHLSKTTGPNSAFCQAGLQIKTLMCESFTETCRTADVKESREKKGLD